MLGVSCLIINPLLPKLLTPCNASGNIRLFKYHHREYSSLSQGWDDTNYEILCIPSLLFKYFLGLLEMTENGNVRKWPPHMGRVLDQLSHYGTPEHVFIKKLYLGFLVHSQHILLRVIKLRLHVPSNDA